MIGQTLGPYRITTEVARGGQATLYKAVHTVLGRETALKVLHPHLITVADFLQKFEAESKILARLKHPNIVAVYDAGVDNGMYWIAMEWLDGQAVDDLIAQQGKLSVDLAVRIADQVAAALEYAHAQGLIHRDIKPGNMMLLPDGTVKVLDFGIAAIIAAGQKAVTRIGTVEYMSYEQFNSQADHRSDLYSLGASLYHMLTGQLPPTLAAHPPTPPSQLNPAITAGLEQVLYKVLQLDPTKRQQTANEFTQDLQEAVSGKAAISQPAGFPCPSCGAVNRMWARYCYHCGKSLIPAARIGKRPLKVVATALVTQERKVEPEFKWSPDGSVLLYSLTLGSTKGLFLANIRVASELSRFTVTQSASEADDSLRRWFLDPEAVPPGGSGSRWLRGFMGSLKSKALIEGQPQIWSPDRQWYYSVEEKAIVNRDRGTKRVLPAEERYGVTAAEWLNPDWLMVIYEYISQEAVSFGYASYACLYDLHADEPRIVYGHGFEVSPNRQMVAYILRDLNGLAIIHLDAGREQVLLSTQGDSLSFLFSPTWSPDSSKLLFRRAGTIWWEKEGTIWAVNIDGSGLQRLTEGYAPQWSPDGRHIAFLRSPKEGEYELWVMRVETA